MTEKKNYTNDSSILGEPCNPTINNKPEFT